MPKERIYNWRVRLCVIGGTEDLFFNDYRDALDAYNNNPNAACMYRYDFVLNEWVHMGTRISTNPHEPHTSDWFSWEERWGALNAM